MELPKLDSFKHIVVLRDNEAEEEIYAIFLVKSREDSVTLEEKIYELKHRWQDNDESMDLVNYIKDKLYNLEYLMIDPSDLNNVYI